MSNQIIIGLLTLVVFILTISIVLSTKKKSNFGVEVKELANVKNTLYVVRKDVKTITSADESSIEIEAQKQFDTAIGVMPTVFSQFPYNVQIVFITDNTVDTGSVFLAINGKSTSITNELDLTETRQAIFDLVTENYF
jgi:hypothetical protein